MIQDSRWTLPEACDEAGILASLQTQGRFTRGASILCVPCYRLAACEWEQLRPRALSMGQKPCK